MESRVLGAANVVGCEALATIPSLLNRAIQDVTRRLVDGVMCELENGESICSLQTVEQNQFNDVNSVEIRRTAKIQRLVRCGECEYTCRGDAHEIWCTGRGSPCQLVAPDGFCDKGKRRAETIVPAERSE